jgi:hypothetical protein
MSLGPDKVVFPRDLFNGTGTGLSSTGAGPTIVLAPGKKVIQTINPSTAVGTLKIQNSLDAVTWFDVTSEAGTASHLLEVDSIVPYWRNNVTVFTTAAAAANPFVAIIANEPV